MRGKRSKMTVGQWLDEWLDTYVEPRLRDGELARSTVAGYRGHVRRYLKPEIGALELRRLGPEQVGALYLKMGAPRAEGGYGLSVRTRELTHVTLRMALERAVALGHIKRNVLTHGGGVDRPRVHRRRVTALERDGAVALLAALSSDGTAGRRLFIPALLALTCGLRRGEVLALRVSDITLPPRLAPGALGMLTVCRAWDKTDDPRIGYAPLERYSIRQWPKSGHERYVDLPPEVVRVLRDELARRASLKRVAGEDWRTYGVRSDGTRIDWGELLVCDAYGRPWWPDSFSSAWYQWCKKQGIRCRFHDLRATSGSISLAAGVDPEVVSARLGHHSAAFFLEHYAKPMHSARIADAGIMGALVAEALDGHPGP
ncbi:MAG: site-specific integrase [Coriobacteriia bacterium]|nr:site-specific integrase [Coriobacteriia bacterium]